MNEALEPTIDAVVIGRNEGRRLHDCLASLSGQVRRIVYVDSGSTDGSADHAKSVGAEVIALDLAKPFTAARARNAGLMAMAQDPPTYVQFVDGDCQVQPGWLQAARDGFADHPRAVVVCGRRREKFPDASIYNRLADQEWNTAIGQARACGGDALMSFAAIHAVGGFRDSLIAGEEPELCLRLRQNGGQIWRIDAEMTLHDAAMTRFSQWWRRCVRAGHAFAEGSFLHGKPPENHWVAETRRCLFWGAALPALILFLGLWSPIFWGLLIVYPLQIIRLSRKLGLSDSFFMLLSKFAEARGVIDFHLNRWRGRRLGLIEYK